MTKQIRTTPNYIAHSYITEKAATLECTLRKRAARKLREYPARAIRWEYGNVEGSGRSFPTSEARELVTARESRWKEMSVTALDNPGLCVKRDATERRIELPKHEAYALIKSLPRQHPLFPPNPRDTDVEHLLTEISIYGQWSTYEHPLNDPDNKLAVGDFDANEEGLDIADHFEHLVGHYYGNEAVLELADEDALHWYFDSNRIVQIPIYAAFEMHGGPTGDSRLSLGVCDSVSYLPRRLMSGHRMRRGWASMQLAAVKHMSSPIVCEQEEFPFRDVYPEQRDLTHAELVDIAISELTSEVLDYSFWLENRAYVIELYDYKSYRRVSETGAVIGELHWEEHIEGLIARLNVFRKQKIN
jgi:hypothetical protein